MVPELHLRQASAAGQPQSTKEGPQQDTWWTAAAGTGCPGLPQPWSPLRWGKVTRGSDPWACSYAGPEPHPVGAGRSGERSCGGKAGTARTGARIPGRRGRRDVLCRGGSRGSECRRGSTAHPVLPLKLCEEYKDLRSYKYTGGSRAREPLRKSGTKMGPGGWWSQRGRPAGRLSGVPSRVGATVTLAPRPHLWDHQLYEGSLPKDGSPPGATDGTTWPAWRPRPARPDPQPLPSPKHDSFSACTCLPHGHQLQGPSAPPHPGLSPEGFPIPAAFLPEPSE